ncbi:MAG: ThuA domain-containing protein [Bryobacterales bacterium]|jgi:hypothetical protein|nr:ThuA domain-containing protein [Bryobacterales bacterium]
MKRSLFVMLCACVLAGAFSLMAAEPVRVMLLDGESGGPFHAWEQTTPYLKRMLEDTGMFRVDVVTAPPKDGDFSGFHPTWSNYKAIVMNYDAPDERWNDALRSSFERYVREGGGLVIVHAANNAFPKWKEFNRMVGVGGWRGRTEADGPMFHWLDGKIVADTSPGRGGSHGPRHQYVVDTRVPEHPIMRGLPAGWLHASDELYDRMRGPGENMTVLATAYSDAAKKGTGRHEPILMVLRYGEGRIFHTVLGHDLEALNCVGFMATYQRGTEWAATGKVTQAVPKDFPSATQVRTRPAYAPPAK